MRRVTRLNDAKVAAARFGKPEQFTFKGAKGDTVYGYIVHPVDFDPAKKYPVAFLIHGGPQGSFGNDFHYRWNPQAYAGAGYAVVMIDFHGSTGYGQAFTDAINDDWGGAPFEDLMKGLDFALAKYPFLDGDRVGRARRLVRRLHDQLDRRPHRPLQVPGLPRRQPRRAHGLLRHRGAVVPGVGARRPALGQPGGLRASTTRSSSCENWKTPMLVIHGEKDFRVVDTQGISTFTALQRKGIPSKLLYLPGREPLGAQAGQLDPVARDRARLARPVAEEVGKRQ